MMATMTIEEMKSLKKQLHWTNEELAKRAGIPLSTVAKILGGTTKNPRQESVRAMEAAFQAGRQTAFISGNVGSVDPALAPHSSTNASTVSGNGSVDLTRNDHDPVPYTIPHVANHAVCEPVYVYGSEARTDDVDDEEGTTSGTKETGSYLHHPGSYTIDDYLKLPADPRVELIDGQFYTMEAPSWFHQKILFHIWKTIDSCIEEHNADCEAMGAPYDVQLFNDPFTVVHPDVMIFCHVPYEDVRIRAHRAPDFVAEVLSPSTGFRDRTQKLCRYRDAGVKEVWIVSPKKQKIWVYRFYAGCEDPDEYTFHDTVSLGISDKRCRVDFSRILKYAPTDTGSAHFQDS